MAKTIEEKINDVLKLVWGYAFLIAGLASGIYVALLIWPTGITDLPLSQLTLGMIGSAIAAICAPFIGFWLGVILAVSFE